MTQEYKEMIDRLAVARNHEGGQWILATQAPDTYEVAIESESHDLFKLEIIRELIESVLSDERSDEVFNVVRGIILDAVRERETQRFQRRDTEAET